MLSFNTFLAEAATEDKLSHLEHAEDHVINAKEEGFNHAFNTLHSVHEHLQGKKSGVSVSTKYDGSPSIVFGHHPETGKFFVASKSAFNKNPKLNYSHADVEKNHGHAPGLVAKLKSALTHLPKVVPDKGVYQGDFMYNKKDGDVKESAGSFHFKPNTITYSAKKGSEHGDKISKSKIGVVVHTAYKGDTLDSMKAQYNADTSHFKQHPDVHLISPKFDKGRVHYTPAAQKEFVHHMKEAVASHKKVKDYGALDPHQEHMKTYVNKEVKEGGQPSHAGYIKHLSGIYAKKAEGVSTEKAKQKHIDTGKKLVSHAKQHQESLNSILETHKHLQQAKNVLVNTLSQHQDFHHSIDGNQVKPEGHVAVINNRPTKLVDRNEFSRLNLLSRPR